MLSKTKAMPWWLVIVTGLVILAAGIFLLISPSKGLVLLTFLLGLGVFGFCIYNFYNAFVNRDDSRYFTLFLVHALLDLVLFLLILVIKSTPVLLGAILSSWFIVFGVFGIINARQDGGDKQKARTGALLLLIGVVLIIIPLLLRLNYIVFLGIVSMIIGVLRAVQGFIRKTHEDTNGRSRLI